MEDGVEETLEELTSRHKRERKELQAKIQALKKSATKGDKKKKKEVQEEIAQLEMNLTEKQEEEAAALSQTVPDVGNEETKDFFVACGDVASSSNSQARVSKAQKRREKKAVVDKKRDELIKEYEKVAVEGPRYKESAAIDLLLKERGLTVYSITADGNCLYNAVKHQLQRLSDGTKPVMSLEELRKVTADHLRQHNDQFLPFLTHPDTGEMLTPEQFEEYCRKVERTAAWGGQVELQALSSILQRRIEVIHATGPPIILGEEFSPDKGVIILTYHRHLYRLGEHYNSVMSVPDVRAIMNEFETLANDFEPVELL